MINEIVRLQQLGYSIRRIGVELDIGRGRVKYLLDKHKNLVEMVDTETNEIVSVKDIKFEEKIYHYIENIDGEININKFYNLLEALKEFIPDTKKFTKKTLRSWKSKRKFTDSSLFSMEWVYDLYVQQLNKTYSLKMVKGRGYVSGKDFYGTIKWKSRVKEIGSIINKFTRDGYSIVVERINNMSNDEYTAPLKHFYLPVASTLWWNYGADVMQDIDKLPDFMYYRTSGRAEISQELRREVIGQHMNNQAIVPKFVLHEWGLPYRCSMEEVCRVLGTWDS